MRLHAIRSLSANLLLSATLVVLAAAAPAMADGIDTPSGVPTLPLSVEGNPVLKLHNDLSATFSSSVAVGMTTAACKPAIAGTIRFNSQTSTFEGCNGTAWLSLMHDIQIVGQGDGMADKTGTAACAAIGKTCVNVISANFINHNYDADFATTANMCAGRYNTGLPGVSQGTDQDNIHDCSALLGKRRTFLDNWRMCDAFFSAVCQ